MTAKFTKTLLPILVVLCCSSAWSHDPGFSSTNVDLSDKRLVATMTFTWADIESVVGAKKNSDGVISDVEFAKTAHEVSSLAQKAVRLSTGGDHLLGRISDIQRGENDEISFRLTFDVIERDGLALFVEILSKLPPGHRQFLSVRDSTGTLLLQTLLKTDDFTVGIPALAETATTQSGLTKIVGEGIHHIWIGYDHIAFLILLLLPVMARRTSVRETVKDVLKTVTVFTVAHSITLAMAVYKVVQIPSYIAESAIAVSIIVAGVLNLRPAWSVHGWKIALIFGLVHGFGFAGALSDLGIAGAGLGTVLFGFNFGVELGQLAIVVAILPLLIVAGKTKICSRVMLPASSVLLTLLGTYWLVVRLN